MLGASAHSQRECAYGVRSALLRCRAVHRVCEAQCIHDVRGSASSSPSSVASHADHIWVGRQRVDVHLNLKLLAWANALRELSTNQPAQALQINRFRWCAKMAVKGWQFGGRTVTTTGGSGPSGPSGSTCICCPATMPSGTTTVTDCIRSSRAYRRRADARTITARSPVRTVRRP